MNDGLVQNTAEVIIVGALARVVSQRLKSSEVVVLFMMWTTMV